MQEMQELLNEEPDSLNTDTIVEIASVEE
jgi:hypothetical protein